MSPPAREPVSCPSAEGQDAGDDRGGRRPDTIVLVAHLSAKGGRIARAARAAAALFTANGFRATILSTESPATGTDEPSGAQGARAWGRPLRRCLARSRGEGIAAVVAVGGDGMAHLVLNALLEHQAQGGRALPFGLIASGSGNDLARHWKTPHDDPEQAAGRILRRLDTGPAFMDVGQAAFDDGSRAWFATALCAGIDAAVNERANRWRRPSGSLKYLIALVVEIVRHPPHRYGLEVTEAGRTRRREIEALMVNVANTSSIGGGLRIVPRASATDGQLELFVVDPLTRLRFLRLFPSIYTGAHVRVPEVEISPATRVRMTGKHVVYADGEPLGELPVTITVLPAALPVLL
ncbi:diacylglycerol/lipid kinase family protein [Kocuria coralli]|uniref:diacylglycerol/lipid kinase family protein n=1 Tax=Kocuria coralli TaxID=1461025 RepID=UPI0015F2B3D9|nr:diacylglycerol kinase family protein [Kocuria coralli]